jgi:hypothetical protein
VFSNKPPKQSRKEKTTRESSLFAKPRLRQVLTKFQKDCPLEIGKKLALRDEELEALRAIQKCGDDGAILGRLDIRGNP